jgi:hypothetical protein
MLKALRQHPLLVGMVEVLVDAARYVVIVLLMLLLLGQLATSRSEAARVTSSDPDADHDGADAIMRWPGPGHTPGERGEPSGASLESSPLLRLAE